MSVYDGHGLKGHGIAEFTEKCFRNTIEAAGRDLMAKNMTEQRLSAFFVNMFTDVQTKLQTSERSEADLSGTTALLALITRHYLCSAGVGDSQGVLVCVEGNKLIPIVLQEQHHFLSSKVRKHIVDSGGRIEKMTNVKGEPVGPLRVWLKVHNKMNMKLCNIATY